MQQENTKSLFRTIKVPALVIPRPASAIAQDLKDAEKKKRLFQPRQFNIGEKKQS
jgi:hypothetical protein